MNIVAWHTNAHDSRLASVASVTFRLHFRIVSEEELRGTYRGCSFRVSYSILRGHRPYSRQLIEAEISSPFDQDSTDKIEQITRRMNGRPCKDRVQKFHVVEPIVNDSQK